MGLLRLIVLACLITIIPTGCGGSEASDNDGDAVETGVALALTQTAEAGAAATQTFSAAVESAVAARSTEAIVPTEAPAESTPEPTAEPIPASIAAETTATAHRQGRGVPDDRPLRLTDITLNDTVIPEAYELEEVTDIPTDDLPSNAVLAGITNRFAATPDSYSWVDMQFGRLDCYQYDSDSHAIAAVENHVYYNTSVEGTEVEPAEVELSVSEVVAFDGVYHGDTDLEISIIIARQYSFVCDLVGFSFVASPLEELENVAEAAFTQPVSPRNAQNVIFSDGIHQVGDDIPAGTYVNDLPLEGCYWARLSGTLGVDRNVISNEFVTVPIEQVVTINESDVAFMVEGCGSWRHVGS